MSARCCDRIWLFSAFSFGGSILGRPPKYTAVWPGPRPSPAVISINLLNCSHLAGLGVLGHGEIIVQARVARAAAFSLSFLLLSLASVHAQASPPATPEESPSLSGIAHNFITWLHDLPRSGAHQHHRIASSLPLPRPRPATPAPSHAAAGEPKKSVVLIND